MNENISQSHAILMHMMILDTYTRKNAQVDAMLMKTVLNNVLLPTLFIAVNNIEQLLHPIQAQQHCSILLTSVINVGSKTLFSPVEQRARRYLPCSELY
jgi:hypothetical protein